MAEYLNLYHPSWEKSEDYLFLLKMEATIVESEPDWLLFRAISCGSPWWLLTNLFHKIFSHFGDTAFLIK